MALQTRDNSLRARTWARLVALDGVPDMPDKIDRITMASTHRIVGRGRAECVLRHNVKGRSGGPCRGVDGDLPEGIVVIDRRVLGPA